jgi:cardiolipin synthase
LQNAVLHSKLAVVDGDAIILGADTAAQVEALLQRDAAASTPITLQAWQNRSLGERLDEFEARLWEYWM